MKKRLYRGPKQAAFQNLTEQQSEPNSIYTETHMTEDSALLQRVLDTFAQRVSPAGIRM